MVWGSSAVLTQICTFSLVYGYPGDNYISLDSQRRMLNYNRKFVNISNKIKLHNKREFRNCNFSDIFLN